MKLSPRIYVPALVALGVAIVIGFLFLWQIRSSVSLIENGFKSIKDKTAEMLGGPLIGNNTVPDSQSQSDALLFMRQGEIFELKGQWKSAEEKYQNSVEAGGGTPALRKLASIQLQRREYDAAQQTVRTIKKQDGDSDAVMFLEGLLQLRSGDLIGARRTFGQKPESPQSQYGLAIIEIGQRNHEQAKIELAKAAQNSDPTIRSYANTILSAYNEFALFERGQDIHLSTLVARALAQTNECETALSLQTEVVARQDNYRDAWIVKGYCEFVTERLPEAMESLERAYSIDPEKPEVQYFLARTYAAMGDPQNAVTYLQYAIINGFEPEIDARELLAEYALELGNTALALDQYKALYKMDGSSFETFEKYVDLALNVPDQALEAYQAAKVAQTRWPDDAKALTLLGRAAVAAGDREIAENSFNSALQIDPKYAKAADELKKLREIPPAGTN